MDEPVARQHARARPAAVATACTTRCVGLGVQVELMTPQPGLPDLVFTANAGLVFGKRFFSSRFRHEVRARETPHFDAWFAAHGFAVEHLPEGIYFEGAGDALFCGETLFAGYRIRSDVRGHQYLGQACCTPGAAAGAGQSALLSPRHLLLPAGARRGDLLSRTPSTPMAARCWRRTSRGCWPSTRRRRSASAATPWSSARRWSRTPAASSWRRTCASWGYEPVAVELDEFLKAGGSAKCLTLRLDGEEAARSGPTRAYTAHRRKRQLASDSVCTL